MLLKAILFLTLSFHAANAASCGGTITASNGTITSPNYPKPYNTSLNCEWIIKVIRGSVIQITVTDLNITGGSETCDQDSLTFIPKGSKKLKTYCGSQTVPVYETKDNEVTVKFISDSAAHPNVKGFSLDYITITPTTAPPTTPNVTTPAKPTSNSTAATTTPATATPKSGSNKDLPGWCIALIVILVILAVLLIIDLVLYCRQMGVIYTIKTKCEYSSV